MLSISLNGPSFRQALAAAEKQVSFAAIVALTRTAQATGKHLSGEMPRVFDRPTPYTVNAFYTRPATKARPEAEVGIKDQAPKGTPAAKYLLPQIMGGTRRRKRGERSVFLAGLLPDGFLVPARGIRLNAYGNVPGPLMVRIISDLRASPETGYAANRTARSQARNRNYRAERFFVPEPDSGLKAGIWVRRGKRVQPAFLWVPRVNYRVRFDFDRLGQAFAAERYPEEFRRALRSAVDRQGTGLSVGLAV